MSAVSDMGSTLQAQYLKELQQGRSGQSGAPDFRAEFESRLENAARTVGVDPGKIPDLVKQIQDAAQNAAKAGASPVENRAAVKDAVDGVLKQNGIDPAKFRDAMAPKGVGRRGHHHGHHGGVPGAKPKADDTLSGPTIGSDGSILGTGIDTAA